MTSQLTPALLPVLALALALGPGSLLGIASAAPSAQPLRAHMPADKVTFDWQKSTSEMDLPVLLNLQEGLTRLNSERKIVPAVAEKWAYDPSGTIITFQLRKDVFWSDGIQVTAQDFVAAIKRLLTQSQGLTTSYLAFDIKGAKEYYEGQNKDFSLVGATAPTPTTLKVELKAQDWNWVERTSFPALFPIREDQILAKGSSWTSPGALVSNGPFLLTSYTTGKELVLKANPYYQTRAVRSREVRLEICSYDEAINRALSGRLDILLNLPYRYEELLKKDKRIRVIRNMPSRIRKIDFNLKRYPTNLPMVRKGLVQGIDRQELVKNLDQRWIPAYSWQLPGMPAYRDKPVLAYDKSGARAAMNAIFPSAQSRAKLKLLIPNFDESRGEQVEIGLFLKKRWESIFNVEIELLIADSAQSYTLLRDSGEYHLLLRDFTIDGANPVQLFEPYASGSRFGYQWQDPTFDDGVRLARTIRDAQKKRELLEKLDKFLLNEQVAVLPLFYKGDLTALSPTVQGFEAEHWRNYLLRNFWVGSPSTPSKQPTKASGRR